LLEDRDFGGGAGMRAVDAVRAHEIDPKASRGNNPKR
jgi:hypothetical protein